MYLFSFLLARQIVPGMLVIVHSSLDATLLGLLKGLLFNPFTIVFTLQLSNHCLHK